MPPRKGGGKPWSHIFGHVLTLETCWSFSSAFIITFYHTPRGRLEKKCGWILQKARFEGRITALDLTSNAVVWGMLGNQRELYAAFFICFRGQEAEGLAFSPLCGAAFGNCWEAAGAGRRGARRRNGFPFGQIG